MAAMVEPRALVSDEIPQVIEEYRQATVNAYQAGFDVKTLYTPGEKGYTDYPEFVN